MADGGGVSLNAAPPARVEGRDESPVRASAGSHDSSIEAAADLPAPRKYAPRNFAGYYPTLRNTNWPPNVGSSVLRTVRLPKKCCAVLIECAILSHRCLLLRDLEVSDIE